MATKKVTELPDATAVTDTDYFLIVDDTGGTPLTSRVDATDVRRYVRRGAFTLIDHNASGSVNLDLSQTVLRYHITASDDITDITVTNGAASGEVVDYLVRITCDTQGINISTPTTAEGWTNIPESMIPGESFVMYASDWED